MDQKIFYVVEIEYNACVFDNIKDASYFMREAAEHIIIGRYHVFTPEIRMTAYTYEQMCSIFSNDYKKEADADEATTCTDADQTEE